MWRLLIIASLLTVFAVPVRASIHVKNTAELRLQLSAKEDAAALAGQLDKIEKERWPEIKSIVIDGAFFEVGHFALLTRFGKVEDLRLDSDSVTDEIVAAIPKFPLTKLTIRNRLVTGATFKSLASFRLRSLELAGCRLSNEGCKSIGELVHLRRLGLMNTGISDDDLAALRPLVLLEFLDLLNDKNLSPSGLAALQGMSQLQELRLPYHLGDAHGGLSLPPLPRLEAIYINHASPEALARLKDFPSLKMLSISESEISEESARLISTLHLETLSLDGNQISATVVLALCDSRTLEKLYWHSPAVSPKFMRALARLPLTELSLQNCSLTDEEIDPLTRHPSLTNVNLFNTKISDRSLGTLASLPCLHYLDIRACDNLTPKGLLALKRAKTLELLMMKIEGSDNELDELMKANPHLEVLDHFGL